MQSHVIEKSQDLAQALAQALSQKFDITVNITKNDQNSIQFETPFVTTSYSYRYRYSEVSPEELALANTIIEGDVRCLRYFGGYRKQMAKTVKALQEVKELDGLVQRIQMYGSEGDSIHETIRFTIPVDKLDKVLSAITRANIKVADVKDSSAPINSGSEKAKEINSSDVKDASSPPSYAASEGAKEAKASDVKDDVPPSYSDTMGASQSQSGSGLFSNSSDNKNQAIKAIEILQKLMDAKNDEKIVGMDIVGEKVAIKTEEDPDKKAKTRDAVKKYFPNDVENDSGECFFYVPIKCLIANLQKLEEELYKAQNPRRTRYVTRGPVQQS